MGQKIHPIAVRLGINRPFDSLWFDDQYKSSFQKEQLARKIIQSFFEKIQTNTSNLILGRIFYQKSHKKTIITFFIYKEKIKDKLKNKKRTRRPFFFKYSSKNSKLISQKKQRVVTKKFFNSFLNLHSQNHSLQGYSYHQFLSFFTQTYFKPLPSLVSNYQSRTSLFNTKKLNFVRYLIFLRNKMRVSTPKEFMKFKEILYFTNIPERRHTFETLNSVLKLQNSKSPKLLNFNTFLKKQQLHPLFYRLEESLNFLFRENIYLQPILCRSISNSAEFLAQEIGSIIQKNKKKKMPITAIKRLILNTNTKNGIRILCSGRLGGAEMARTFYFKKGQTSLNIFAQKIDFASRKALTKYGIIGVKVWISYGWDR